MKGNLQLSKEIAGSGCTQDSKKSRASHFIMMDKVLFFKKLHQHTKE
jgi:hypothetical protein